MLSWRTCDFKVPVSGGRPLSAKRLFVSGRSPPNPTKRTRQDRGTKYAERDCLYCKGLQWCSIVCSIVGDSTEGLGTVTCICQYPEEAGFVS